MDRFMKHSILELVMIPTNHEPRIEHTQKHLLQVILNDEEIIASRFVLKILIYKSIRHSGHTQEFH